MCHGNTKIPCDYKPRHYLRRPAYCTITPPLPSPDTITERESIQRSPFKKGMVCPRDIYLYILRSSARIDSDRYAYS